MWCTEDHGRLSTVQPGSTQWWSPPQRVPYQFRFGFALHGMIFTLDSFAMCYRNSWPQNKHFVENVLPLRPSRIKMSLFFSSEQIWRNFALHHLFTNGLGLCITSKVTIRYVSLYRGHDMYHDVGLRWISPQQYLVKLLFIKHCIL